MTDKSSSHADRLEQALRGLDASKRAAADMAASIEPELERLATLNEQLEALPQSERRQVLDAMGLKHVSAAPKPITPLRGSSYIHPRTPAALPDIDWRYWRHIPEVKQWEACALSLNINPDNIKHSPQGWMAGPGSGPVFLAVSFPSMDVQLEFDKRVRLLGASLFKSPHFTAVNNLVRGGRHLATVNLREFAAWALHVEFDDMPPELVAMAATATTVLVVMPAQTAAPLVPVGAVGASGDVEPDKAGPAKPLQRTAAQDSAILCEIEKQGYDPLARPKNHPGKPGVKAAIRAALSQNSLFTGRTVFDKAWERLTARADIAIQG